MIQNLNGILKVSTRNMDINWKKNERKKYQIRLIEKELKTTRFL
jgi:hypothetical protein